MGLQEQTGGKRGPDTNSALATTRAFTSSRGADAGNKPVNAPVSNSKLNKTWNERWKGDGRTIKTLNRQGKAPLTTRNGTQVTLCLGFNYAGKCFSQCSRAATHFDGECPATTSAYFNAGVDFRRLGSSGKWVTRAVGALPLRGTLL
jgi:hypothetical protein